MPDLETDEAIYSFAVDRFLEIGDWLAPRASPSETAVFLEKPPLKFWLVAASIRAGILPHDEFGLRFWDAVFGGVAFLYVFAIGGRMAGPLCGLVAVFILFVHAPLVFNHGLRTNNMESALVLSYCGGVWHFLCWDQAVRTKQRAMHAAAVGLFFVLGFMTKFVAVLFLPLILVMSAAIVRPTGVRVAQDRRLWTWILALVLVLIAPWFVYAQVRFGRALWDTMFSAHVYQRFTSSLNPVHVQPWNFYITQLAQRFGDSRSGWLVLIGVTALILRAFARPSLETVMVLLWGALPLALISLGTSKLYHYVYPFLPPLALAGGYPVALGALLIRAPLRRGLEAAEDFVARRAGPLRAARRRTWLPGAMTMVIWVAAILALAAVAGYPVRIATARGLIFKSSGLLRPMLVIAAAGVLARRSARVVPLLVAVGTLGVLPLDRYRVTVSSLREELHPIRSVRDCIRQVQARAGDDSGLYVDTNTPIWHPTYYYLRQVRPWIRQETPLPDELDRRLHDPARWRPSLVSEVRYQEYQNGQKGHRFRPDTSLPSIKLYEHILFLPGPYAVCRPEGAADGSR